MVGNKIFLFGGNDTLQSLSTIDMQTLSYLVLTLRLTLFGTPSNLYPSHRISKQFSFKTKKEKLQQSIY